MEDVIKLLEGIRQYTYKDVRHVIVLCSSEGLKEFTKYAIKPDSNIYQKLVDGILIYTMPKMEVTFQMVFIPTLNFDQKTFEDYKPELKYHIVPLYYESK